jgi:DNA polymerase IV
LRRCPDAVFLPVDAPAYEAASAQVMETLRAHGAVVEVLGWDEAFLGVATEQPEEVARELQRSVIERTGLHSSVGIGDNKLRAKIATSFGKPRGTFRLTEENWYSVMGERPTDALWGIGRKTAKRLATLGIDTVAQLALADPQWLADEMGPTMGPWYRRLGRGVDSSPVDATPWLARSHSRESTFQHDLDAWDEVEAELRRLAVRVAADLDREGRPALRVAVKVRFAPFQTVTRSRALPEPTYDAQRIGDLAVALAGQLDRSRAVRLLGVRAEMALP